MLKVTLWVAESADLEDAFAVDPLFAEPGANATKQWCEARLFRDRVDSEMWCRANPIPKFNPCSLTLDVPYLH
jgi:hypothetical protein